ncbi:hypothetical protein KCP75_01075 [Salmonella enterica subsp. enterica]|nr:hypothetical protein KCP75_01075 [Salmonella enterica subsp. enterica]
MAAVKRYYPAYGQVLLFWRPAGWRREARYQHGQYCFCDCRMATRSIALSGLRASTVCRRISASTIRHFSIPSLFSISLRWHRFGIRRLRPSEMHVMVVSFSAFKISTTFEGIFRNAYYSAWRSGRG